MVKKRTSKQIMKAYTNVMDNANGSKRKQIQILDKVHLEQDEFTEHKELKHALIDFVVEAQKLETSYQAHRKQMIREIALRLEDELNRIKKPELISRISEELIRILKQAGVRWNPIYLRRCLDDRYKNPVNRANALAREHHPGVVEDSGRSVEQLEAALKAEREKNKTIAVGEYIVKKDFKLVKSFKTEKEIGDFHEKLDNAMMIEEVDKNTSKLILTLPAIIKVNVKERDAILEADMDTFNQRIES